MQEEKSKDWFENKKEGASKAKEGDTSKYKAFTEKFEPKRTTDDCYTPNVVYDAVATWVENEYGVKRENFVRPFFPGGNFEKYEYKSTDIVVDNPPFSILALILRAYGKMGVKYFLFCPALTAFSSSSSSSVLCAGVSITYENKACVDTSFVTNLEPFEVRARSCPSLHSAVKKAAEEFTSAMIKTRPTYSYPDNIITAAFLNKLSKYGVDYVITSQESEQISALDHQRKNGKAIFGKGYIVSERAAAERAAAERAAAERAAAERAAAERAAAERAAAARWQLSDREREIVRKLGMTEEEREAERRRLHPTFFDYPEFTQYDTE